MLLSLFAAASLTSFKQAVPTQFFASKVNFSKPDQPVTGFFLPGEQELLILSRDGELRWLKVGDKVAPQPHKTAKITELPKPKWSPEQVKENEKTIKYLNEVMGGYVDFAMRHVSFQPIKGGTELAITNFYDEIFFFSTADGKLLRKAKVNAGTLKYLTGVPKISESGKYFLTYGLGWPTYQVYDIETGKKVYEKKFSIYVNPQFVASSDALWVNEDSDVRAIDLATGKETMTIKLEPGAGSARVSPDGKKVAYAIYNPKTGEALGNGIYDIASKKVTKVDPLLKKFVPKYWSKDGKHTILYQQKYLHWVNSETGAHEKSVMWTFSCVWAEVFDLFTTGDGNKVLFQPHWFSTIQDTPWLGYVNFSEKGTAIDPKERARWATDKFQPG